MRVAELFEEFDRYEIHDLEEPEDKEVEKVDDIHKLAEKIRANCGRMLAAYKDSGKVLYRGVKGGDANVIITGIRPDRKPVQMGKDKHKALNKYFESRRLKVNRGNSIFVTARAKIANDWGETYAVFVKDGWTAQVYDKKRNTYSFYSLRNVAEMLLDLAEKKKIAKHPGTDAGERQWALNSIEELPPHIDEQFDELGVREFTSSSDLTTVLRMGYYEALVVGDSYIGVRVKSPMFKALLKELGI
jgi:hypothetical protein